VSISRREWPYSFCWRWWPT